MLDRGSAAAMILLVCASACAPATRFEWGSYETSLYAYSKNPAGRDAYKKALEEAIAAGRENGKIAPGLLSELGYLLLEQGDTVAAAQLFEEEIKLFPESREFLSSVLQRARVGSAATGAAS